MHCTLYYYYLYVRAYNTVQYTRNYVDHYVEYAFTDVSKYS